MNKVLLTGASGALGKHVLKHLLADGKEVIAVSHNREIDVSHALLKTVQLDLWDQQEVAKFINEAQPQLLIHLAWEATPGQFWHSQNNLDWVSASSHLLRLFVSAGGKRAILAGSCAEYEWGVESLIEETSALHPTTIYSASKVAFHTLAKTICKDISFAWGRVFFPYSPFEDKKRLVRYVADAVKNGLIPEIGVPDRAIDLIHLDDVAKIFAKLVDSPVEGDINICRGEAITPYEVAKEFAKLCCNAALEEQFNELGQSTKSNTKVVGDTSKLQTVLPLDSLRTLEQGFSEFL